MRWLIGFLAACRIGFEHRPTAVRASIDVVGSISIVDLDARMAFAGVDPNALQAIPATGGAPTLPTEVRFVLPDESGDFALALAAHDTVGRPLVASATTQVIAGTEQQVTIVLGAELPTRCLDGIRDGDETGVDCGGSCLPCPLGAACLAPSDCETAACQTTCEPATGPPSWTAIADMPVGRIGVAAALGHDGEIYVFGGGLNDNTLTTEVDAYDPPTDRWSLAPPLMVKRCRASGTVGPDGTIYAIGGCAPGGGVLASVESYVPGFARWVAAPSLPVARKELAAGMTADGTVYAVGGNANLATETALIETLTGNVWVEHAAMPTPRGNLAATGGSDGKLYVIGGHNQTDSLYYGTVEVYDAMTDTWSTAPSLIKARSDFAAVAGPDGRIYAMAGFNNTQLNSVEAYRIGAPKWTSVAPLATARDSGAATLGADGRIYMFGGRPNVSDGLVSGEAYGPSFALAATTGAVGDAVGVTGGNFSASAAVRLYFDAVPIELATTDATGALPAGTAFHVPTATLGAHVIRAVDARSRYPVTTQFTVR